MNSRRVVSIPSIGADLAIGAVLAVLALIAACGGPPKAQVLADVTAGQAPLTVSFTNKSSNADRFEWDFGDGTRTTTTDTEEAVTHEYTKAGTHTVTLTATKEGEPDETSTVTLSVTVEPAPLDTVVLESTEVTLSPTQAQVFSSAAFDRFDNPIPGLTYNFRSKPEAGQVDSQGRFSAGTKAGTYDDAVTVETIQGTVTKTATARVIVEPGPVTRVVLEPRAPTVEVAKEQQFTAQAFDRFDNAIPGLAYTFRSVAQAGLVDSQGRFKAGTKAGAYAGAVTVEVAQDAIARTATADVTIAPGPLLQIRLEPATATVEVTLEQRFTAQAFDRFDNAIPGLAYTFRSAEQAGQVDGQGRFTAGTKAGAYDNAVTAEVAQGLVTKTATARVIVEPGPLNRVVLEPGAPTVEVAKEQQFTATALDRFDNPIPGLFYTFRSKPEAGQVDGHGSFTAGTKAGTYDDAVTVEVTQGKVEGKKVTKRTAVKVIVQPGPIHRITISPAVVSLQIGASQRFTAAGFDQYGNGIPELAFLWEATGGPIGRDGLFTAGAVGGIFEVAVHAVHKQKAASAASRVMVATERLAAGWSHNCAVTKVGGVMCWGYNGTGTLGDGTTTDRTTPVDVVGLTSGIAAVSAGYKHTCALTTAGGVKCWGNNEHGQLGDGTGGPGKISTTPVDVVGLTTGVASISVGGGFLAHTCALTTAGGVKCWGDNSYGQMGDGTSGTRTSPVDVSGLTSGVVSISSGHIHTCVVTTAGGVKCWGQNLNGYLGDGTTIDRRTPVGVIGLTGVVTVVAAGLHNTCVLTTAGGVKCWGYSGQGKLGDGTTTDRTTPVDVAGLTSGVAAVSMGWSHTCAVTTAGGVKCWGQNAWGAVGDFTIANRTSPVDVAGLTSGVATVSAGALHTCALTTEGGVKCWGYNGLGALGNGTAGVGNFRAFPGDVVGFPGGVPVPVPPPIPPLTPSPTTPTPSAAPVRSPTPTTARKYCQQLSMGVGHAGPRPESRVLVAERCISENNQRYFYARWQEFMNAESWRTSTGTGRTTPVDDPPCQVRFDGETSDTNAFESWFDRE